MTIDLPREAILDAYRKKAPADLASLLSGTPFGGSPPQGTSTNGAVGTPLDPSGGTVSDAIQKVGLKLNRTKAPFKTFIIEHLEKSPTEN